MAGEFREMNPPKGLAFPLHVNYTKFAHGLYSKQKQPPKSSSAAEELSECETRIKEATGMRIKVSSHFDIEWDSSPTETEFSDDGVFAD